MVHLIGHGRDGHDDFDDSGLCVGATRDWHFFPGLATGDGLYRFVRHPQYTGLFIALFGEGVVHWPTLFSVGLFPVIVFAYYMLARKEERQVLAEFGETYRAYQQRVPMFIPRREQWRAFVGSSSLNSDD